MVGVGGATGSVRLERPLCLEIDLDEPTLLSTERERESTTKFMISGSH